MGSVDDLPKLKKLISSLAFLQSTADKEKTLCEISELWRALVSNGIRATDILHGNKILQVFSSVIDTKSQEWAQAWPYWTDDLLYCMRQERDLEPEFYPQNQMQEAVRSFRKYILSGQFGCLVAFRHLATLRGFQQLLINDNEFYNALKKGSDPNVLKFCYGICGSNDWKLKFMSDTVFIEYLLGFPENNDVWSLFTYLAQHPDAKTLLPIKEVISKASKSNYARRTELCALLCSDDDLHFLELSPDWLDSSCDILRKLMQVGKVVVHNTGITLLAAVLPIVNLSAIDARKELLGKHFIALLKQVLTDKPPDTEYTTAHLPRSMQEAAKALWSLAYFQSNRVLIGNDNGVEKLKVVLAETADATLKQNISGVLHMLESPPEDTSHKSLDDKKKGHIMISYNWGNQSIVKNIAKSLKENGYNVWLDVEQMNGSTLEAMAHAVEQSETVLICMSQKYKDSPNCRLEGEYCVNRKTRFIPLMMQKGYRPDGWLGIALGSKLYYEFTDETNWEGKITELTKAIGDHGKKSDLTAKVAPANPHTSTSEPKKVDIEWSDEDLHNWMKSERIDQHYELFKKHDFNRRALLELQQHYLPNPKFFFTMWEKLGITEYGKILQISAAIRNLK